MTNFAAPSFEQSALVLAWLAIVLLAFAMSGLMRQVHALSRAMHGGRPLNAGPTVGMSAPKIPQLDSAGRSVLLFVDQSCPSCNDAVAAMARIAKDKVSDEAYAIVYRGSAPSDIAQPGLFAVTDASRLFEALNIVVTPTVVVLNEHRRVVAGAPIGSRQALSHSAQRIDYWMLSCGAGVVEVQQHEGSGDDRADAPRVEADVA